MWGTGTPKEAAGLPHQQPGVPAPSLYGRSPASGAAGQHLSPPNPGGGPGPRWLPLPQRWHLKLHGLWLFPSSTLATLCFRTQLLQREHNKGLCAVSAQSWYDISFDHISLGLGKGKLCFKPTNLVILWGFILGSPPIQSLSWIFWGFVPLSYPTLFTAFPGWTPPLYGGHVGSYVQDSGEEFSLSLFIPYPPSSPLPY